ncbi:MAG: alpha/beta hydrolase [Pseudomonadota bacterium]|nr:MAG: alpha/beta hydrolase [Pseudomonadota bacterium]
MGPAGREDVLRDEKKEAIARLLSSAGSTPSREPFGLGAPLSSFAARWAQGSVPVLDPPPQRSALAANGARLRLALNVKTSEAGTVATLDSPDMGATGLPVNGLNRDADKVEFGVPVASVRYSARLNAESTEMCGKWLLPGQPDATVCLQLESGEKAQPPARNRPQEPGDDVPYQRREVRLANPRAGDIELAGTLTVPDGPGPFPAAVLISGSGPQDRDESFMGHKPFLVLADHLTRNGVAVLRYDDRGFGASGGDHWAATTADFATDAAAAVEWLAQRPDIRTDAIGLIGHSEGGLVAPITARDNPNVAWVVLLAAPGIDMLELVASQTEAMALTQGVSTGELQRVMPVNRRIWRIVAETADAEQARARLEAALTPEVLETLGASPERKPVIVQSSLRPWLRYLLRFDPAPYLRALEVPVLALNGGLDVQVPAAQNLAAIRAALADHPDATVIELPGLNHLFQTATTGALGEYRDIEETFAPAALEVISDWILDRYPADAQASGAAGCGGCRRHSTELQYCWSSNSHNRSHQR